MRPEAIEKIFERFYTDRPEQGFGQNSGLGLSISKQIVEAHGGRIWAENRTAAGSDGEPRVLGARFIVRLPAMLMTVIATIHATAVLVGATGVLIRGEPGSGKSRLALRLLEAAGRELPFARLVADDRVYLESRAGRLVVRPPPELAGLLEMRGTGIRACAVRGRGGRGLVIDLGQPS